VALSFLISVAAIYSYGFSGKFSLANPYVSTQTGLHLDSGRSGEADTGITLNQNPGQSNDDFHSGTSGYRFVCAPSLLNIEWSYQLDPLSSIFMLSSPVWVCAFRFCHRLHA